ncbi:MAG: hypothetical protein KIS83_10670 [Rubrivivax sp.]|nr:hypothetical protein [Rubrivivax sp.]
MHIRPGTMLAPLALALAPALAAAQGLYGSTVEGSLLFPTASDVAAGPISATVGPDVEFPADAFLPGRNFATDIGEAQLVYLPGETTTYGAADYNGFRFVFSGAPDIVAVTLHAGSTFAPVSFEWTANSLSFDLSGLSVTASDRLEFTVSTVPELPTAGLLVAGLWALGAIGSRRRRAAA